ncbi:MAG TPA: ribonucleotide-diphosphate reductase subunit alpha, partial [Taishania sp.]|nr:ribonucleotide-diphosphate reductase subunit alpha [Taishania sp.]
MEQEIIEKELKKDTMERLWWKNEESEQILNRGYLLKGETVEGAIDRVASAAARRLYKPELKEAFVEMIERGWMSLSSPIWANMGTERGLPISCFNVHVPDSIESITHKLGEVIMQTKTGGGTSGYFGDLRARGSAVTDNGMSSGAVSFMRLFDTAMDTISQGGVRRGAFAAYLDIDHPDCEEFLQIKDIGSPIQNLFNAVCVPDYWMQEMIDGDVEKRALWAKVLESRQQKGLPYIFFTDNVNRNK